MSSGGKRDGAGRKAGYRKPGARRNPVSLRLNDAEMGKALILGDGNAADGLREALRRARIDYRTKPEQGG